MFITGIVFSISLALALLARVGVFYASTVMIAVCSLVIWLWAQARSPVVLTDECLVVGRAKIERRWISQIDVLDAQGFLNRIRAGALSTDYFALRRLDYGGVVLHISDPSDPHRHWVISMKHGKEFQDTWKQTSNG